MPSKQNFSVPTHFRSTEFVTDAMVRHQKLQAYQEALNELNEYTARMQEVVKALEDEEANLLR